MTALVQPALDGSVPEPKTTATRRQVEAFDDWLDQIRPAFEHAAASGREFTAFSVADANDLPDPRHPQSQWGRAMTLFRDEGLIETAGWACSDRPTAHHSGVRTWRGTAAARAGRAAA
ncbi:hypothetical protein ACFYM2_21350 [Streptomyces sp. NPDC006711]|uniref:hypothetical protein n=1 Tax=Streptomyces sp. NPDC006711 TaxID=3364762 RepID=UPI0036835074